VSGGRREGTARVLGGQGFDRLLAVLDPDRDEAGRRYDLFRRKLVRFFEWRGAPWPDELADETLDRVATRLAAGESIRSADPGAYFHGVARNVLREHWERDRRVARGGPLAEPAVDEDQALEAVETERRLSCLERCLAAVPPETHRLLLRYYSDESRTRIDGRREMAETLGIGLNALRIRMCRLRAVLEVCVRGCVGGETKTTGLHARRKGGAA
jgi:DNA-directed RNA polymerase specialized sigma24 family protein